MILHSIPPDKVLARSPVNVQYEVGAINSDDGQPFVILELRTPAGEGTYFFPAKFAKKLADDILDRVAKAAAAGLVIPRPHIPPDVLNGGKPS